MSAEIVGRRDRLEVWYEPVTRKDGKPGRRVRTCCAWYTPVLTCEQCGRIATPRRVREREDLFDARIMRARNYEPIVACTACWNRLRPIFAAMNELADLAVVARRLSGGGKL